MTAPAATPTPAPGTPATGGPSGAASPGAGAQPVAPAGPGGPRPGGPGPGGPGAAAPTDGQAPPSEQPGAPGAPAADPRPVRSPYLLDGEFSAPEVTSKAGGSTSRHGFLRAAEVGVDGDLVAGDKVQVHYGDQLPRPNALTAMLAEPVRHAFVHPEGWRSLRQMFRRRRTIILRGAAGTGKVATAIRLLQSTSTADETPIRVVDQDTNLSRLGEVIDADRNNDDPVASGAGYLLCEPAGVATLGAWVLRGLEEALERARARLVLVVDINTPLQDEDLLDHVIHLTHRPSATEILHSHLRWRLGDDVAERVRAQPDLSDLIEQLLDADAPCKRGADLALVISECVSSDVADVPRIRNRMSRWTEDTFDMWFDGITDVGTRCYATALAVLNGLPHEQVSRAATALLKRVEHPRKLVIAGERGLPPELDPFRLNRRQLLRVLRARTDQRDILTVYGFLPAEVLEYMDPDYRHRVLVRMWRDYQIQDHLVDWLRDLIDNDSEQVRIYAATALGVLAGDSFEHVYDSALTHLAADEGENRREAAAQAMFIAMRTPGLRPATERLVHVWYMAGGTKPGNDVEDDDARRRQATAARIYGRSIAISGPDAAIAMLNRLAAINDKRTARAIGDSFADMLLDREELALPVLRTLTQWFDDRQRSLVGQYAFVMLAETVVSYVDAGDGGSGKVLWPTLLWFADRRPELRTVLTMLWRHTLTRSYFARAAETVLTFWVAYAEADDLVRTALTRMILATVGADARARDVLLHCTREWRRQLDNLQQYPKTAAAVEAALMNGRGPR